MKRTSVLLVSLLSCWMMAGSASATGTLDDRVAKLERMMESGGLLQLMQEIDRLKSEISLLRGQLEEKDYEISELKRKQREMYADVENRFQRLQKETTPTVGVAVTTPSVTTPAEDTNAAQPLAAVTLPADDKSAYQAAYALVKQQKFPEAEQQFAAFTQKFPKSSYTDNAYYWLGEVQLVQAKYTDALKSFHKVFEFSESTKRADALLKIGFAYYELEKWPQARKFLEQLQKIYPDSGAAKLGASKLKQLAEQGH